MSGFEIIVSIIVALLVAFDASYAFSVNRRLDRLEENVLNHISQCSVHIAHLEAKVDGLISLSH